MGRAGAGRIPSSCSRPRSASRTSKRLKEAGDSVDYFFRIAATLGDRLGPVLFQLPPNLKKDLPRLEAFPDDAAAGDPRRVRVPARLLVRRRVFEALRARGAALCIAEDEELATPLVATAGWGYLRLRRQDYGDGGPADARRALSRPAWGELFVFFKHEDGGRGAGPRARVRGVFRRLKPPSLCYT